ncbi:cobalamin biosynthesis protein CobQ [Paraburkholderia sp. Ac-20347]|uniref:nucleotide-binding protein n=1 Tax=Paraburkholderia sp. Ac-20347 TaxID=2703892 RepID=UPI00197F9200|nr:cobalamin biosynthesis protein CobQ [Paraburkholderia sp. Ac-20347]MBN3808156.1 ParA family protein [Paraburkholderia sp. Ac-20347]
MKRFVMVCGDKGGTGKSLMARALADRLRREQCEALMIDCDGEIGSLFQFHAKLDARGEPHVDQASGGVIPIRFTGTERERDQLLACVDHNNALVLADMPAASLTQLRQFDLDTGFFSELASRDYRATLVNVLSPFSASTRTVREMIELAGEGADYVVAINQWFGDQEDFFMWYGNAHNTPSSGLTMLHEVGGIEIALPRLQAGVLVAIDDLMLSFSDARTDARLTTPQRSRLHRWMQALDDELDEAAQLLGLALPARAQDAHDEP